MPVPLRMRLRLPATAFSLHLCRLLLLTLSGLIASAWAQDPGNPPPASASWGQRYSQQIAPLLESRCVVCHGCYDAPCQLKLSSPDGIARGASNTEVYDGKRLREVPPTRLNMDASTTAQWRDMGFYPVLNEERPGLNAAHNPQASLLYQMLDLKRRHPLQPGQTLLPASISTGIGRAQSCPKPGEFRQFAERNPLWGMPYGLPGLSHQEFDLLRDWLSAGAPMALAEPPAPAIAAEVAHWEAFFNQPSNKARLINRYIYEHLFLAHLYFSDAADSPFFELVRSRTPPGQPLDLIASRRPYDDPGAAAVYYRLRPVTETLLAKTHMPYALSAARQRHWEQWFYAPDYRVDTLPGYGVKTASNPFITFRDLPVEARYRFMLDEAEFTIMGFIKGPVCRGQVALNVIRDRFWVFFKAPDVHAPGESAEFLAAQSQHLHLPAEADNTLLPLGYWLDYSAQQRRYLQAKYQTAEQMLASERIRLDLAMIWDGDGTNPNAALTIFRHFDSATVVKGLVGEPTDTVWVVDYPVLERIHYLLVAGFDVFGNVGHQLLTRLYMDFLRMESEFNFLMLLPRATQTRLWEQWYEDARTDVTRYVQDNSRLFSHGTSMVYTSANPEQELLAQLREHVRPVLQHGWDISAGAVPLQHQRWLTQISYLHGHNVALLPQTVVLLVETAGQPLQIYTLLHNNAHSNISSLLDEASYRRPERDDLTLVKGVLGAYPAAFWRVSETDLPALAQGLADLQTEEDYRAFMDKFGVRRTDPDFWYYSDRVHQFYRQQRGRAYGLLDYNRLENR